MAEKQLKCLWLANGQFCHQEFPTGAEMFHHLTEYHIGRKSTGNLSLLCCWNNCGHTTEKRDHIVSHARVHVPSYKPYACKECDKSFSRSQDLKKHMKTHSRSPEKSPRLLQDRIFPSAASAPASPSLLSPVFNFQQHRPVSSDLSLHSHYQKQGMKRSRDPPRGNSVPSLPDLAVESPVMHEEHALSDFIGSIKRKKLSPEYNDEMAAKLTAIAEFVMPPPPPRLQELPQVHNAPDKPMDNLLMASLQTSNDITELNNFLAQLYNSVQATNDDFAEEAQLMETEALMSAPISDVKLNSNFFAPVSPSLSEQMHFDQDEFATIYHPVPQKDMDLVEDSLSSLSEEEMDKFFDKETQEKNQKRDLRMDILRKGMDQLSMQCKQSNAPLVSRNKLGRFPKNTPKIPTETVEKKSADWMLSDPSSIVRMLKKNGRPSATKQVAKTDSKRLERNVSRTNSRRLSLTLSGQGSSRTLTRSQSQPIMSQYVSSMSQRQQREFHARLVSTMMKHLERLWNEVNNAENLKIQ